MFHRPARLALAAALLAGASQAQLAAPGGETPAPRSLLEPLGAQHGVLQQLEFRAVGENLTTRVRIAGQEEELVLWKHSMRSPDYRLLVQDASGEILPHAPSPVSTYRGVVVGYPESAVAGAYTPEQGFAGLLRLDGQGDVWTIHSAVRVAESAQVETTYGPSAHVVFSGADETPILGTCATDTSDIQRVQDQLGALAGTEQLVLEIACDTDVEFFNDNGGSVANTENDIENVLNGVSGIYLNDVDVAYEITTIIVRTSNPDPYTTNIAGDLLDEFRIEWTQNQQSVHRDVAHLFTGRNLSGFTIGIAYSSSLCQHSLGYGLHQRIFGFNARVGLCAHEIGHNFSAPHCNGASGGCNIMCSSLGGCSGIINAFAPTSINQISGFAAIAGCLDDPTPPDVPVLSAVVPAQVPALVPGPDEHFSLIGQQLDGVTDVIVDGLSLGSLFPPSYSIASPTQIDVKLPLMNELGPVDVTVENVSGSDTTVFEIVAPSPPALQLGSGGDPEVLISAIPLKLTSAGQPGNVIFVWASFTLAPTVIPGTLSMDIGNNFLDLHLAGFPVVADKGWEQLSFVGLSLPPNTTIYFQGFEYDPITGAVPVESTNVQTGLWLF